jgi:hypothetical protein
MAKRTGKRSTWIENPDGTSTFHMTHGDRVGTVTRVWNTVAECVKVVDLFTYFGIDSAIAGRPVDSDINAVATRAEVAK